MGRKVWRSLLAPLLTVIVGAASVDTARAAAYVGAWDPAYGDPFTTTSGYAFNLGWRGAAFFDVPGGCFPGTGGYAMVDAAACGATATSAYVQFYDTADPGTTIEQLDWGGVNPAVGLLSALLFNDNVLIGFDTDGSDRQASTLPNIIIAPIGPMPVWFGLRLEFAGWDSSIGQSYDTTSYNGPVLGWYTCPSGECAAEGASDRSIPIDFRVSIVPEPSAYGLAAAGLLVLGWRARRRPSTTAREA